MQQAGSAVPTGRGRASLVLAIKFGVSAVLLWALLRRVPLVEVVGALSRARLFWVGTAILVYIGSHVLNAFRWSRYTRQLGVSASLARATRHYFAGLFLNLFAPGTVVGDVSRGLALADGRNRVAALAGVVAHRLSGLVALTMIAGSAGLLQRQYPLSPALAAACWVVPLAATTVLLFAPSLVSRALSLIGREFRVPPDWLGATAATLILAIFYHALQIVSVVCLARAIGVGASVPTLSLFVPLVNFAGMVPVSVSGVGVREAGYVFLLGLIGVSRQESLALGLLGSLLVLAAGIAGLPAFLMTRTDNPSAPD